MLKVNVLKMDSLDALLDAQAIELTATQDDAEATAKLTIQHEKELGWLKEHLGIEDVPTADNSVIKDIVHPTVHASNVSAHKVHIGIIRTFTSPQYRTDTNGVIIPHSEYALAIDLDPHGNPLSTNVLNLSIKQANLLCTNSGIQILDKSAFNQVAYEALALKAGTFFSYLRCTRTRKNQGDKYVVNGVERKVGYNYKEDGSEIGANPDFRPYDSIFATHVIDSDTTNQLRAQAIVDRDMRRLDDKWSKLDELNGTF